MKPGKSNYQFCLEPQKVPEINTRYRTIKTLLPHEDDLKVIKTIYRYESSLINKQLPVVWNRAKGFQIYDNHGNKWIDLSSSIFVTNSGHANVRIKEHTLNVIEKDLMHAYCYPTIERANFLEKLIKITPDYLEQASLVSTGTEASERALKLARIYGESFNPKKKIIIGGMGNFHGKTMGSMMVVGAADTSEWAENQDMYQVPFPYPWTLKEKKISGKDFFYETIETLVKTGVEPDEIAAFFIESYQGWGAVFYPDDYISAMSEWAKSRKILIIADEIQSGFGRTGKLFAYEHYNIQPDLVCCGKGISGSMPLSAVLGRKEIIELDAALTSTHGGHPVSCAAALGNLEAFENENLVSRAEEIGKKCHQWLLNWQNEFPERIPLVLGDGMVWAVFISKKDSNELDADFADKLVEKAMQKGVYSIRTGCGTIKIGPPLNIEEEALKEAIDVYVESMKELLAN